MATAGSTAHSGRRRTAWAVVVAASAVAALVLFCPIAVAASCAVAGSLPDAIRSAPTAFVGTVTGLSDGGRRAHVHVEDVWTGHNVPAEVDVIGTPDSSAVATSVDRVFTSGQQYLFLPAGGGPQTYQDNSCTQTQPFTSALASLRPSAAPGAPVAIPPAGFPGVLAVAAALATLAVAACAALAVRRRLTRR
jgi:hypothetical protein